MVPFFLRPVLWMFIALSAVGLIISLYVHLGALMGRRVASEAFFFGLHLGIFVVWIPAILVAKRMVGTTRGKDFWKRVLAGSPEWMKYMVYGFFGYAMVNFALFMFHAPAHPNGGNPPAEVWRGFSGHWMAFYSAALAILYAGANQRSTSARCINGHTLRPGEAYCRQCGQRAAGTH